MSPTAHRERIPIWTDEFVQADEWDEIEYLDPDGSISLVRNVVEPSLTIVPPTGEPSGAAILLAPGGGFRFLAWKEEGTALADRLAALGIRVFLLRYRLIETPRDEVAFRAVIDSLVDTMDRAVAESPGGFPNARVFAGAKAGAARQEGIDDGCQAVRLIRRRSDEWGIDPDRIGMLGFSAGAQITSNVVLSGLQDCRVDFAAAIYGGGIGDDQRVPADAPPLFISVAQDDRYVYRGSLALHDAWHRAGRPVELHSFPTGGHGFGTMPRGLPSDGWVDALERWLT